MASAKTVIFFKDGFGYGWSETFYYNGSLTSSQLISNVNALVNARAGFLTNTCSITHIRVNQGVKRNPAILIPGGGTGLPGNETPPTAPTEVALLFRISGGTAGYNKAFLRGIPERVVAGNNYSPDLQFTVELQFFASTLAGGNWNVQGTLGGGTERFPMSNLVGTLPRGYGFNAAGAAPPIGSVIRVHGTRVPGYSGLKTITNIPAAGSYQVGGASPPQPDNGVAPYYTIPGFFDVPVQGYAVEGLTRRAPGRPFAISRGRRQTLYSLRQ
jgi:hypothetical protein